MKIIKDLIRKKKMKSYGYGAIVSEINPVFGNKFSMTNKEFAIVEDEGVPLETQNGVPVKFHKNFHNYFEKGYSKYEGCEDISFMGVSKGTILTISNMGYLENKTGKYKVLLITDRFIYIESISNGGMLIISHNELERIDSMGELKIENVETSRNEW